MIVMHFINEEMDEKSIELLIGGTGTHVKTSGLQNGMLLTLQGLLLLMDLEVGPGSWQMINENMLKTNKINYLGASEKMFQAVWFNRNKQEEVMR